MGVFRVLLVAAAALLASAYGQQWQWNSASQLVNPLNSTTLDGLIGIPSGRTLRSKLADWTSVFDYAPCSGSGDDTALLQAAVNASSQLYFPPGASCTLCGLVLYFSIEFFGPGALKTKASCSASLISLRGTGLKVSFSGGLTLDGNQANQAFQNGYGIIDGRGLYGTQSSPALVMATGVYFQNPSLFSIYLTGEGNIPSYVSGIVDACYFEGGAAATLPTTYLPSHLYAVDGASIVVGNSFFKSGAALNANNTIGGIVVASTNNSAVLPTNITVTGCDFFNVGGGFAAVDLYAWGHDTTVTGNRFNYAGSYSTAAIRTKTSARQLSITGNVIENCRADCIDIVPNTLPGAVPPYNTRVAIGDNVFRTVGGNVISIAELSAETAFYSIAGNIATNYTGSFLYVQNATAGTVSGNTVSTGALAVTFGASGAAQASWLIGDNSFSLLTSYAVYVEVAQPGLSLVVSDNFFDQPSGFAVYALDTASLILRGNVFRNVQTSLSVAGAISATNCASLTVEENSLLGSYTVGLADNGGNTYVSYQNNNWNGRRLQGTVPPSSGAFAVGDIVYNSAPTQGAPTGWICVTAGSPGLWQTLGANIGFGTANVPYGGAYTVPGVSALNSALFGNLYGSADTSQLTASQNGFTAVFLSNSSGNTTHTLVGFWTALALYPAAFYSYTTTLVAHYLGVIVGNSAALYSAIASRAEVYLASGTNTTFVNGVFGVYAQGLVGTGWTGTCPVAYGIYSQGVTASGSGSSISYAYDFFGAAHTPASGTLTNAYCGVCASQTAATNNYGWVMQPSASGTLVCADTGGSSKGCMSFYNGGMNMYASGSNQVTFDGTSFRGIHFGSNTSPTVAVNANAGTGANATIYGTDHGMQVRLNTGSASTAAGIQFTVSFGTSFITAPYGVVFSPSNPNSAVTTSQPSIDSVSTTSFSFKVQSYLFINSAYYWNFVVSGSSSG